MNARLARRKFLAAGAACATAVLPGRTRGRSTDPPGDEPVLDIHQHTGYLFRSDRQLVAHQRKMGATKTVLLPAGRQVRRPSTHNGSSNGLKGNILGNESAMALAKRHPDLFVFGANEVPDLPDARKVLEKYLKAGAVVIGEQKFNVPCDSPHIWALAEIAREHDVPVLLHFEHNRYNLGIERFHRTLEKFPEVNFVGHAQTWWGNIDKNHNQHQHYPKGPVTPGGITDQLLLNHPNLYGDLSAGSGLNSMLRDEEHARSFLERHQDRLLFGSDCWDPAGQSKGCRGTVILSTIRRLAPCKSAERKILHDNAKKLYKI